MRNQPRQTPAATALSTASRYTVPAPNAKLAASFARERRKVVPTLFSRTTAGVNLTCSEAEATTDTLDRARAVLDRAGGPRLGGGTPNRGAHESICRCKLRRPGAPSAFGYRARALLALARRFPAQQNSGCESDFGFGDFGLDGEGASREKRIQSENHTPRPPRLPIDSPDRR